LTSSRAPNLRRSASTILAAGLEAADPGRLVRKTLALSPRGLKVLGKAHDVRGRIALLAVGKAAVAMAEAAEGILGSRIDEGLAITVSPGAPLSRTVVMAAGHPVPDSRGLEAAKDASALASGLGERDLLLLLLSGGGSALLPSPADGITLADKAETTGLLMKAGATIHELNTVRKHLSSLKGGGLARVAAPARVVTLVLSDVVGDDLSTIASGPTVPDPTTFADALAVLSGRGLLERVPAAVRRHLERGGRGEVPETAKPGEAFFRRVTTTIIGSNRVSVEAASRAARRLGFRPVILTTRLEGEAREVARVLVAILRECVESGRPAPPPVCLLAGGETTVTVTGEGYGGRNQELAVAAAAPLAEFSVPALLASLATDGIDGRSTAAGGVVDDQTLGRAHALGLSAPSIFLRENDSTAFLGPLSDLIVTGPTGTNVVDLTILLAARKRH
jgi:hydroxypyruvate reductase